jgi:hypothetical protein
MYINPTLFGANITGIERSVTYKCNAFNLNSSIYDEDDSLLANQKRTGIWNRSFEITTPNGSYKFYQRWFDYFLEHEGGEKFRTHTTVDFYNDKMKRITHLRRSSKFGKYWEFDLLSEDHKSAFVMASVTICKLNPTV